MTDSLAIFTRASAMLAEADTLQKAKELKDLALTAADWARRKDMGEEAILHCRSYALEAERKIGRMLKNSEKAKGARKPGRGKRGNTLLPRSSDEPTLADVGLSKRDSADAQKLDDLPEEVFEELKAGKKTRRAATREMQRKKARKELAARASRVTKEKQKSLIELCDVRRCSCADLFASGTKPDVVITDPPYPEEFLPVLSELAQSARDVPLVAVMVGQTYLPEVLRRLTEHLKYRWTLAYLTPGGQSVQQFQSKVNTFWKPVLLFGKATEWIGDVTRSEVNDNDKEHHHWGQSESGMADLVRRLTKPDQLVCDPFVGGGTTAVVSLALKRRFVGCDVDAAAVEETWMRVKAAL